MNINPDQDLRRLFAQVEPVAPDEAFVAGVAVQVAARRSRQRYRRLAMAVLCVVAAVALSVGLAPYAPLSVPEGAVAGITHAADAVQGGAVRLPLYLYLAIAAGLLPLAGTAWLLRRH